MRAPAFWRKRGVAACALAPLSWIYAAIAAQRRNSQPYRCPVPVICVGNATAGGSGKTPVALALGVAANAQGIAVHFLTRGYGGREAGPLRVDPGLHDAAAVGDEPLLLARVAPTWVARDRVAGAKAAVAAGAGLIVMDDGLQNPHLAKDLSLLVIDGGYGFGNGMTLPAGPLRERNAQARAQAAILIGQDTTGIAPRLKLPVHHARLAAETHHLSGHRVVAFAGIGRPEKFRETLAAEGIEVAHWMPFPDHHLYTAIDAAALLEAAHVHGASLLTTEKDWVRLPPVVQRQVQTLPVTLRFDQPDAASGLVGQAMEARR